MTGTADPKVVIAGAGPVGMVAALRLAQAGIDVTVYEMGEDLSVDSKASTFHIPTLELMEQLGVIDDMLAQGLKVPGFQQRDRKGGIIAQLDLSLLADETKYPYRLQLEQSKLTRIIRPHLEKFDNARIVYGTRVASAEDLGDRAVAILDDGTRVECDWLIGCDGANSMVRQALVGFEFPGETFAERFLVMSTSFEFRDVLTDLVEVAYITDPDEWVVLLKTPDQWRCLMPVSPDEPDDVATSDARIQERLNSVLADVGHAPVEFDVIQHSIYKVNQRVATSFAWNRVLIAGDAAHMNNPLGGFGMNSGIHDAWSAVDMIEAVRGGADAAKAAEIYGRVRSEACHEFVQANTIKNFKDMQERDREAREARNQMLKALMDDPEAQKQYLRHSSMLTSARTAIQRVKDELAAL
jgi:2-polyprenyl-6-methoxyphenol hydroxylase-like FAD-dependent oxidoreductase